MNDGFDRALVTAMEAHEIEQMLNTENEWIMNISQSLLENSMISNESMMVIPSLTDSSPQSHTYDHSSSDMPSLLDYTMTYDTELKDWIQKPDDVNQLDSTELNQDDGGNDVDVWEFLDQLEQETKTSTQKQCMTCHEHHSEDVLHQCEECLLCNKVVCTCVHPPNKCFLCFNKIGIDCTMHMCIGIY